ncbi:MULTISPECIES: DUF4126 domain-containing protein [unclassified Leucobacter]|uniref:DUF4126 domain-containing protein n=1 Tax=unclassified Leucobacter TaxID=2621730 RepID=UPI00165E8E8B|nr:MULTISPECIES: DUF4126 domain-containing protein [unclassified Leucobacter]MBC9935242.1 DUF4126 domain-containing protein [Leucobacter sp. cx-87]
MIEVVTGLVLASAAGLNAYIPLLGLGLLSRFTELVALPDGWAWLENTWVMVILGVLLAIETLVDKVPALDTVNDVLHTVIRPASGGLVFAAGASSETVAVTDPAAFVSSQNWWPFVIGILVALVPHLLKMISRPVLNAVTGGAGAAVASTAEDIGAVTLTVLAVVVPILALLLLVGLVVWLSLRLRRALRRREAAQLAARASA